MADLGQLPAELGCPCYPQGHPDIPDDALAQALRDKAPFVQYMTTQLCFDPKAIATFIADRRAEGIDLPVKLGIPGVAEIPKLLSISARIGVKDASKFVLRNYRFVGQLLRSGGIYKPSRLLRDLAPTIADPAARVEGLHVYTFRRRGRHRGRPLLRRLRARPRRARRCRGRPARARGRALAGRAPGPGPHRPAHGRGPRHRRELRRRRRPSRGAGDGGRPRRADRPLADDAHLAAARPPRRTALRDLGEHALSD